jgi:uncharacterized protein (TIGR03067 family)
MRKTVMMIKTPILCIAMLFVASALAQDAATDQKALQGTWTPTSGEVAGKKFPEALLKMMSLTINGDKYVVKAGEVTDQGTVKIDVSKKLKAMDIVGTEGPTKGKKMLAIYELDGDTLRVCYDLTGKERPTEFKSTKESGHFLATYQRAK